MMVRQLITGCFLILGVVAALPAQEPIVPEKWMRASVLALPGIEGFDLPLDGRPNSNFAVLLAHEATDPVWAPDMEHRLKEEIQSRPEFGNARVEMVCRTSGCGLLFIASLADDFEQLGKGVARFAGSSFQELGFRAYGTESMRTLDGRRYIFLHLANRREIPSTIWIDLDSLMPKGIPTGEVRSRERAITPNIARGAGEE